MPDRGMMDEWGLDHDQHDTLVSIFGEHYDDCLTAFGAKTLLLTLEEHRDTQPDPIQDGDECPVCGDELVNAHDALRDFEGESVEVEKICVIDFPSESVIHISDDRVNPEPA